MTSAAAAGGQKPLVSVATLLDRLVTLDVRVLMSAACAVISAVRLAVVAAEAVDAACMAAADVAACEMMLALRLAAVAAEAVAAAVMVANRSAVASLGAEHGGARCCPAQHCGAVARQVARKAAGEAGGGGDEAAAAQRARGCLHWLACAGCCT